MTRHRTALVLAAVSSLAVACGGSSSSTGANAGADTHALTGTVSVPGFSTMMKAQKGEKCFPQDGYDSVQSGATLTVKDEAEKVVATGQLAAGAFAENGSQGRYLDQDASEATCRFSFEAEVPDDVKFYTVGISGVGDQTFSHATLEAKSWHITLSVS